MPSPNSDRPAQPFPRAAEIDKPEGEPYRLVSIAPPLGESGAPLLDTVLAELLARGETQVQIHLDVAKNYFVEDPSLEQGEAKREFVLLDLAQAVHLVRR